jgi:hypothetical protein
MRPSDGAAGRENEGPVASGRHTATPVGPVFFISPASLSGVRGRRLLDGSASGDLAARLTRGESVPLGEVYASISSLYFRGKLAYARRFAYRPPTLVVLVITPDRGLRAADDTIQLGDLRRMSLTAIDEREPTYRSALTDSARELASGLPGEAPVVLLGSLATRKYLTPLLEVFGERLQVPRDFIGLGDMSRGGLLLASVAAGRELEYVSAAIAADRLTGRGSVTRPTRRPRRSRAEPLG